jgi:hypothetical protein
MEDWDHKSNANATWINLRPFIQKANQQHLQMGTMMAAQGGYATNNQFAGLTADDEISKNGTAETIAGTIADTITSHMAHLSTQTATPLKTNASQINVSLQQLVANNNQLHQQQQIMMQQMAMLLTNQCTAVTTRTRNTTSGTRNNYPGGTNANPIYSAPPLHQYPPQYQPQYQQPFQQQFVQRGGGRGGGSRGGRAGCGRGAGGGQGPPMPMPHIGGN